MNKIKPQSTPTISKAASTSKSLKPGRSIAPKPATTTVKKSVAGTKPAGKTAAAATKTSPVSGLGHKSPAKPATRKTAAVLPSSKAPGKGTASEIKKEAPIQNTSARKSKLVRDSFTLPETEYALFKVLKKKALESGTKIKKGELVRAGMAALALMSTAELTKALAGIERIKKGHIKKK